MLQFVILSGNQGWMWVWFDFLNVDSSDGQIWELTVYCWPAFAIICSLADFNAHCKWNCILLKHCTTTICILFPWLRNHGLHFLYYTNHITAEIKFILNFQTDLPAKRHQKVFKYGFNTKKQYVDVATSDLRVSQSQWGF